VVVRAKSARPNLAGREVDLLGMKSARFAIEELGNLFGGSEDGHKDEEGDIELGDEDRVAGKHPLEHMEAVATKHGQPPGQQQHQYLHPEHHLLNNNNNNKRMVRKRKKRKEKKEKFRQHTVDALTWDFLTEAVGP